MVTDLQHKFPSHCQMTQETKHSLFLCVLFMDGYTRKLPLSEVSPFSEVRNWQIIDEPS